MGETDLALMIQKLDSKIDQVAHSLLVKFTSVVVVVVGIAFIGFAYMFDYRLDSTNPLYQSQIDGLKSAVYVPKSDLILQEVQGLKAQMDGKKKKRNTVISSKKKLKKK